MTFLVTLVACLVLVGIPDSARTCAVSNGGSRGCKAIPMVQLANEENSQSVPALCSPGHMVRSATAVTLDGRQSRRVQRAAGRWSARSKAICVGASAGNMAKASTVLQSAVAEREQSFRPATDKL